MSKHTQTPWVACEDDEWTVLDQDGDAVCITLRGSASQDEVDRAFILRACNAHEQLVTVLSKIANNARMAADDVDALAWAMELSDIERDARAALIAAGVA